MTTCLTDVCGMSFVSWPEDVSLCLVCFLFILIIVDDNKPY